jgi:glutaconate CoA-transferase, subunit A
MPSDCGPDLAPDIRDKLMTPAEAVSRFVKDGVQISLGGFTINRNPMAMVYEICRQRVKDLHLVAHSNGQALDVLVGAGCVARIEIAYGGNGRFAPTCIRFRKAAERGEVLVEDYSNYQMTLRFLAGALSVPFVPTKSGLETDLVRLQGFNDELREQLAAADEREGRVARVPRQKLVVSDNPFDHDGDQVILLPALTPDVTILHAQYVGDDGTVRIKGLTFADIEQAKAASAVIVSCEEIVPRHWIRTDPDQNTLPHFLVDAIVPAPYGAHPTACRYFYDYDPSHLNHYKAVAKDDEAWAGYLDEWVYGVADHDAYLDKVGASQLCRIRANTVIGYTPGLDRR